MKDEIMRRFFFFLIFLFLSTSNVSFASLQNSSASVPTLQDIKNVVGYYYSGTREISLVDSKFCTEIYQKGKERRNCKTTIKEPFFDISKNDDVFLWLNFFVPADNITGVLVQFISNGRTRNTTHIPLKSDFRFRKWVKIPTTRLGEWKIVIIQELDRKTDKNIATIFYKVVDGKEKKKMATIKSLETAVKALPMHEYEKNLRIYRELLNLDPKNKKYKTKVEFYTSKLSKTK